LISDIEYIVDGNISFYQTLLFYIIKIFVYDTFWGWNTKVYLPKNVKNGYIAFCPQIYI